MVLQAERKAGMPKVQERVSAEFKIPTGLSKVSRPAYTSKMRDIETLKRIVSGLVKRGFEPPTEARLLSCYIYWCRRIVSSRKWESENKEVKRRLDREAWAKEKADAQYHAVRLERRRETYRKRMEDPEYRTMKNQIRRAWWARTYKPKERELGEGQKRMIERLREKKRLEPSASGSSKRQLEAHRVAI